jgi:hypothetical protein
MKLLSRRRVLNPLPCVVVGQRSPFRSGGLSAMPFIIGGEDRDIFCFESVLTRETASNTNIESGKRNLLDTIESSASAFSPVPCWLRQRGTGFFHG